MSIIKHQRQNILIKKTYYDLLSGNVSILFLNTEIFNRVCYPLFMNKFLLLSLLLLGVANLIYIRSYSIQTNNVLEAAAELKANGIKYDICNINGVPCLVYTVGDQPFYYDGLIASYALDFIPTTSVAKNYTLPTSLYFPPNSCLVKALVEYKQHSSAPIDVIVFIPNHAQNIYAYSLPEFEEELSEFGHIRINAVFVKGQFIINTK